MLVKKNNFISFSFTFIKKNKKNRYIFLHNYEWRWLQTTDLEEPFFI